MFPCPPKLSSLQHCKCIARILQFGATGASAVGFGIARAGHDKDTLPLSTEKILWVWALQGYVAMGTAGILWVGHCRDTLLLGAAGILCGWALQDALRLCTAGVFCAAHCRGTW